jgi:hypothetical protein
MREISLTTERTGQSRHSCRPAGLQPLRESHHRGLGQLPCRVTPEFPASAAMLGVAFGLGLGVVAGLSVRGARDGMRAHWDNRPCMARAWRERVH